ncbi:AraC family transcriptional regulator [Klebsiella oxytoca]|nr:AraC family transcriptional regulator [Klebsiella oxytoca]
MDPLSDVLHLLSAKSYITSGLTAPDTWGLHFPGFDGLKFFAVQKGKARFRTDEQTEWHTLQQGDGIILTRLQGFDLTTPGSEVSGESEETPYVLCDGIANYGGEALMMIAGKMEIDRSAADILLNELPPVIFISSGSDEASVFSWLMNYIRSEKLFPKPGSDIVTDHLMHLMMIEGIRSWLSRSDSSHQGWSSALRDHRIMTVLSAIHHEPSRNWRLPEFAEMAGMSRAGFVRRFCQLTGSTPLNYLTDWRMRLASKALRSSQTPVGQIGFSLGYGSESAFSTAFKRVYGCSPLEHRRQA